MRYKLFFSLLILSFVALSLTYCAKEEEETAESTSSTSAEEPVTGKLVAYRDTTSSRAGDVNYQLLVIGTYSSDEGFTQAASYAFNVETGATSAEIEFDPFQRPMAMAPNSQTMLVAFRQEFIGYTSKIDVYLVDLRDLSSITPTKILTLNDRDVYVTYEADNRAYVIAQSSESLYAAYVIDPVNANVTGTYDISLSSLYNDISIDPTDNFTSSTGDVDYEMALSVIPGSGNYMGVALNKSRFSTYIDFNSFITNGTSVLKISLYSKHKLYKLALSFDNFTTTPVSDTIELYATAEGVVSTSSDGVVVNINSAAGFGGFTTMFLSNKTLDKYLAQVMGLSFITGSAADDSLYSALHNLEDFDIRWYRIVDSNVTEITPADLGTANITCTVSGSPTTIETPLLPMAFVWAPFNNIYYGAMPFGADTDECDVNMKIYAYNPDWPAGSEGSYLLDIPDNPPSGVDGDGRIYVKVNGSLTLPYH